MDQTAPVQLAECCRKLDGDAQKLSNFERRSGQFNWLTLVADADEAGQRF